jgi:hypothetical protein
VAAGRRAAHPAAGERLSAWDAVGAGGLGLPEPPASLAPAVERVGDQRWGTRRGTPSLRGLGWYADEFEEGRAPDYVLAGREDVATNTGAVEYAFVCGRLGLFVIAGVGAGGGRMLALLRELQDRASLALEDGPLHGEGRLSVVHNDFANRRWRWTGPGEDGGIDGVAGALEWLDHRLRTGE